MTLKQAKQEFEIRYYRWAISEFEKEIDEGFPRFRLFKTGAVWELHQFMLQLPKRDQLTLAGGLLKRFHAGAVNFLGESCSTEEANLRHQRDGFFGHRRNYQAIEQWEKKGLVAEAHQLSQGFCPEIIAAFSKIPLSLEEKIASRKLAGESVKFIGKRKLLTLVAARFQQAFNGQCIETYRTHEIDPHLNFQLKCGKWMIGTQFWFGRRESLLNYSHSIASETDFEQQGAKEPYLGPLVIATLISFTSWLGITSQTEWECLVDEEVEPACEGAMKLCGHFFEVAPKLLDGIEPEKLTGD